MTGKPGSLVELQYHALTVFCFFILKKTAGTAKKIFSFEAFFCIFKIHVYFRCLLYYLPYPSIEKLWRCRPCISQNGDIPTWIASWKPSEAVNAPYRSQRVDTWWLPHRPADRQSYGTGRKTVWTFYHIPKKYIGLSHFTPSHISSFVLNCSGFECKYWSGLFIDFTYSLR